MNIFLTVDKNQEPGLYNLINSILIHTSSTIYFYILVDDDIEHYKKKIKWLETMIKKPIQFTIKSIKSYQYIYQFLQTNIKVYFKDTHIINIMNFSRFYLPIIFDNVERAIYMDIDMIVQHDISIFYNTDISNFIACSPLIRSLKTMEFNNKLNIDDNKMGFNAGIYLFNVKYWKQHNFTEKTQQLMVKNKKQKMFGTGTQAIVNYLFYNKIKNIDNKWNFCNLGYDNNIELNQIKEAFILHWNGQYKPWLLNGLYKDIWNKYSI